MGQQTVKSLTFYTAVDAHALRHVSEACPRCKARRARPLPSSVTILAQAILAYSFVCCLKVAYHEKEAAVGQTVSCQSLG